MYELSMSCTPGTRLWYLKCEADNSGISDRLRLVIERLAALGLLKSTPSQRESRQPSYLYPLLPPLLAHLHPPTSSALPAYPATFLPSIFLPLPASTLSALVNSLLQHLSFRIGALKPGTPDENAHRAVEILELIIGKAEAGGEAWVAVMRAVSAQRTLVDSTNIQEHVIARIVCGWVRPGGAAGTSTERSSDSS
jgi:telomere length regulation protein